MSSTLKIESPAYDGLETLSTLVFGVGIILTRKW